MTPTRGRNLLVHFDPPSPATDALLAFMAGCGWSVESADDLSGLLPAPRHRAVLVVTERPIPAPLAADLVRWVEAGGGLLLVGPTLRAWAGSGIGRAAGWAPSGDGPLTELVVDPEPVAATERLEAGVQVRDRLALSDRAPVGVEMIATAGWRHRRQPVAFTREVGRGRIGYLGLGNSEPAALAHPWVRRLAHRIALTCTGGRPGGQLGVGLIGFGAVARGHAEAAGEIPGLSLKAVCDTAPARLEAARRDFDAAGYVTPEDLLADPQVDLVVVGTPPSSHAALAGMALAAGKHVVIEKPMALTVAEVDAVMEAATAAGRVVSVYQSRRWDPDYLAMREAVEAGAIGEPFYFEAFVGGHLHPCNYWHSHEPISGGTIYDWGSHYIDQLLQLLPGRIVRLTAQSHKRVWHDVTNADQTRVDLVFEDGRQAMFIHSDVAAALKPKWYLLGTGGALVGDWRLESVNSRDWSGDLIETRLEAAEVPARLRLLVPDGRALQHAHDGRPQTHETVLAIGPRPRFGFYRNLADHLLTGEPLAVTPEQSRRVVAVLEQSGVSAREGGRQLEVDI